MKKEFGDLKNQMTASEYLRRTIYNSGLSDEQKILLSAHNVDTIDNTINFYRNVPHDNMSLGAIVRTLRNLHELKTEVDGKTYVITDIVGDVKVLDWDTLCCIIDF